MKRRDFMKTVAAASAAGAVVPLGCLTGAAPAKDAANARTASREGVRHVLSKRPGTPDHALYTERQSDMLGLGPDGKPVPGYKAAGAGVAGGGADHGGVLRAR